MYKKTDFYYSKSGEIFNQHFYWTKQPIEVIEYFIKKFSIENETIYDPFCGSGVTGIASQRLNRQSFLSDISPASLHITEGYNLKISFNEDELNQFLKLLEFKLSSLYQVSLDGDKENYQVLFDVIGEVYKDKNGNEISESEEIFNSIRNNSSFKTNISKDCKFSNYKSIYKCIIKDNKKQYVDIKELKENSINDLDKNKIPLDYFFGKEPKRNYKKGIKQVYQLYSKRNLKGLIIIKEEIDKISNQNFKKFLEFCFSSILFNCSLMSRFRKYENTSIKMGTYYIPKLIKDNNVYLSFSRKVKSIFKAKKNIFDNEYNVPPQIFKEDASKMHNIKNSSVDLIYADPPYGDLINYSELNLVIESWLGLDKKYINEMIIDPSSNKDEEYFFKLFKNFLIEASRVLKKNKFLILIYHNPNLEIWRQLQRVIHSSTFEHRQTLKPIRILSKNKTSSQRNTSKKTQGFLAIVLKNNKNHKETLLKKLTIKRLNHINRICEENGYYGIKDKFDFFINYSLNRFEIDNSINSFLEQSDHH